MGKHIKFTTESFFERVKENPNSPNIEFKTTEINNAYDLISCVCKKCTHSWVTTAAKLIYRKSGCPRCNGGGYKYTQEDFLKQLSEDHPELEALGEYTGCENKVKIRCLVCGNEWDATPDKLHQGCGCPKCANKSRGDIRRKTQDEFERELKDVNASIQIIGKYKNTVSPIKCKCLICSHEWEGRPNNLLRGVGCPACYSSIGENKIQIYLKDNNISYKTQYTFSDCKAKKKLRFDFYIPSQNLAIEFDGIQHYEIVDWGYHDMEKAKEVFDGVKERDKIKNDYCKNHNIGLLRIPYWDIDNINRILSENLN